MTCTCFWLLYCIEKKMIIRIFKVSLLFLILFWIWLIFIQSWKKNTTPIKSFQSKKKCITGEQKSWNWLTVPLDPLGRKTIRYEIRCCLGDHVFQRGEFLFQTPLQINYYQKSDWKLKITHNSLRMKFSQGNKNNCASQIKQKSN